MPQISMLYVRNDPATNKSTPNSECIIKKVDSGNMVDDTSIVSKANMLASEFWTQFLISGARLAFAKLKQAFNTAPI